MSTRRLNDWIASYLQYTKYSESDDKFHFWTAVATIAGALRRKVWIDQGYFQWTPNFYIVFVAPPGIVAKSTTINIGIRLLRQIPDIAFGPDAVTWQALTESLANSTEEVVDPDTGEYLPMSCITIASSEFGTFLNPSDREMVDVMVSLWDGQIGTWEKATKTQGSETIVNPWINMIACTTPAWIAQNFPEYMIGGGFTSRTVFVYGDRKRNLVAYPGLKLPKAHFKLEDNLVHDLEQISKVVGQMQMSPDAVAWGEEWYEKHYNDNLAHSIEDLKTAGYKARKQTHIHKLAIILSLARDDELIITQDDLFRANNLITQLEQEMPKVFSLVGRSASARATEEVLAIVSRHKALDKVVLFKELHKTLSAQEIDEGIRTCIEAGLIGRRQEQGRILIFDASLTLTS